MTFSAAIAEGIRWRTVASETWNLAIIDLNAEWSYSVRGDGPERRAFKAPANGRSRSLRAGRFPDLPAIHRRKLARLEGCHLGAEAMRTLKDTLMAALMSGSPGAEVRRLVESGEMGWILPSVAAMAGVEQPAEHHPEGCVLSHTCAALDIAAAADYPDRAELMLAVLMHIAENDIATAGNTQLALVPNGTGAVTALLPITATRAYGRWFWTFSQAAIPADATSITLRLYGRLNGARAVTTYYSAAVLAAGDEPRRAQP